MRNVWTIALKDLRLLWRDKWGMFWVLAFPLMMAVFLGSLMSGMGQQSPMRIAVLDEDQSELSKSFVAKLKESSAVEVQERQAPLKVAQSKEKPENSSDKKNDSGAANAEDIAPLELLRREVQSGRLPAYVRIKDGFGETGLIPSAGLIEIGVDPGREVESGLLQGVVMEAAFAPFQDMFSQPAKMKGQATKWLDELDKTEDWPADKQAELTALKTLLRSYDSFADFMDDEVFRGSSPLGIGKPDIQKIAGQRDGPLSGYEISFPQSITWGIFGCVSAFAMSLVTERVFGTYLRLRVAPITRAEILAGKGMACFLACALVSVVMLALARVVFGVRVLDPLKLTVAIASASACFVGLMMFASVMGRTERAVAGSVWAIIMPLAMLGGSMVPQFVMPRWMQTIGSVSPVKWTIRSFEGAIWRDLPWSEMLTASGILVGMGAVLYAIGLAILLKYDA
jgi:ABC-2 type transport system permease protein